MQTRAAGLVNIMCGFGVQAMKTTEAMTKVYTKGCISSIQGFVESNLYTVGGIAFGVALAQLFGESRLR